MKKLLGDLAAVAALSFLVATASAQDTTFKLFHENPAIPAGTTLDDKLELKVDRMVMKADVPGFDVSTEMTMLIDGTTASRIISPDKLVSVIKEMNSKAIVKTGDETVEHEEPIPLIGKKFVSERVDGRWKCSLLEGEPDDEEKEILEQVQAATQQMTDGWKELYGDKEYKVGDTVRASVPIYSAFGLGEKNFRGKTNLKIEKIEELNGVRCAVLKGRVGEAGKLKPDAKQGIDDGSVAVNADVTIWRSIDFSEDMRVEVDGTLEMNILSVGIAMKGKGPIKIVREITVRKK